MRITRLTGFGLALLLMLSLLISCSGNKGGQMSQKHELPAMSTVADSSWAKVSQMRIFFGHQSVGENIVAGLQDIIPQHDAIQLPIVVSREPADYNQPVFGHTKVGENGNTSSKCEDFERVLQAGVGDSVDVAFLKFCYVDIRQNTDIEQMFDQYKQTYDRLKSQFPNMVFVHLTVPLRTVQPYNWKAPIKRLLGKPLWGYDDNIQRHRFNEMIRQTYAGKEPVFDIAFFESIRPDGTQETFEQDGQTYPTLVPAYTYDDGHLNEAGRKVIAEQLLILLANLELPERTVSADMAKK